MINLPQRGPRYFIIFTFVLFAFGLYFSYYFLIDVDYVAKFVQQYSLEKVQDDLHDHPAAHEDAQKIPQPPSAVAQFRPLLDDENQSSSKSLEYNNFTANNNNTSSLPASPNLKQEKQEQEKVSSSSLLNENEPVCKLPELLIDDPVIKPFLKEYPPLGCSKEKNWVYTHNGRFYIDPGAEAKHGPVKSCRYWRYDRVDDDNFKEVDMGEFHNGTALNGDQFYVRCSASDGARYDNIHAGVPVPSEGLMRRLENAKSAGNSKGRGMNMSVLVYIMDSVSRINFIRKLPKFYSLLTGEMDGYVMEGFNIVGDGTPYAMIPMLTGYHQFELPEARKRFSRNSTYVDDWPFLYKNFTSSSAYVTSYAEEMPQFGFLQYKLKGFKRQPVDHYLRTMLLAVNRYKDAYHRPYCLGDTPRSLVWLNFWRELQNTYRPLGARQFSVMFSAETSHDDYNYVQVLDEHWTGEFGELYRNGYFNDTLLLVMADHGRRFGPVRQTQSGKIEEKLPFLTIITPPAFRKRYPIADRNLRTNRNRLLTVFDLHETFLDLLNYNSAETEGRNNLGNLSNRGISLFKEIPATRTCNHARIKAHFCSCLEWSKIDNFDQDPIVIKATAKVIDGYFNRLLLAEEEGGVAGKLCAHLKLGNISWAKLLKPNEKLMAFKETLDYDSSIPNLGGDKQLESVLYQIRFTTEPGGGDWEATLTYFVKSDTLHLSPNDISRLNKYNQQAQCVIKTKGHLRTFCYCL